MRAAWLEIDLDAYRANLRALRTFCGTGLVAVVKANAYGHGLLACARAALQAGAAALAVALPEEGAALREAGDPALRAARIVVLGLTLPEQASLLVEYGLEPLIASPAILPALAEATRCGSPTVGGHQAEAGFAVPNGLRVHVKVDTGMSRAGAAPETALALCQAVRETPGLVLAGFCTHFASAEEENLQHAREQWERFAPLLDALQAQHPGPGARPVLHAANSAATLWFPPARLDWIRPGLVSYGVSPAPRPLPISVRPVMTLKGKIVQVREFPAGARVGYGGTYVTPAPARLALVPLGYGDGLPWALGNRGCALVCGRKAPIRGRVCMDQVILDVTEIPAATVGDEAVFLGRQDGEEITVRELAELAGTIPYEILTRMGERLPRRYLGAPARGDG